MAVPYSDRLHAGGKEAASSWEGQAIVFDVSVIYVDGKQKVDVLSDTAEDSVLVKLYLTRVN
jgi:hypothetical protein